MTGGTMTFGVRLGMGCCCWKGNGSLIRPAWPFKIVKVDNWWRISGMKKIRCPLFLICIGTYDVTKLDSWSFKLLLWRESSKIPPTHDTIVVIREPPWPFSPFKPSFRGPLCHWSISGGTSLNQLNQSFPTESHLSQLEVQDHKNIRTNRRTANQKLSIQARIRYMIYKCLCGNSARRSEKRGIWRVLPLPSPSNSCFGLPAWSLISPGWCTCPCGAGQVTAVMFQRHGMTSNKV